MHNHLVEPGVEGRKVTSHPTSLTTPKPKKRKITAPLCGPF